MFDKIAARRTFNLVLSLCLILSLTPVSIGPSAPAFLPQSTLLPRTVAQTAATHPAPLSQSLSIARAQSSYTAGTLDVVFTLYNNLPVTRLTDIPPGATDEELADLFATFDPLQDANTLRGVIFTDTLAVGMTLISTSGNATQVGNTLTWQLPDLAPLSSTQITLTIQTPSAGSDLIDLDDGGQATALRWGEAISANTRSAVIVPTGIDPTLLATTSAADPYDADLLWYTSGFEHDPLAAFAAVQSFRTDLYPGALRGTRGTLWGEAGNSLDKASALIAMLRLAGVPARYRHGTLSMPQAQTLIASLFPTANGVAGYVPIGTALADPVNDASVIALAADHWWVEAYLPGSGWTNLDPTYPQAVLGQAFATPSSDGTDRAADVPASAHHTLRMRLKKEQYSAFPIGGATLLTAYVLDETFNVSQLAGKRLMLGHLVSEALAGGVFSSITRTYTPYLGIEDNNQGFQGDTFQDYLTNFPLATTFTTAEWLEYEIHSPAGHTETFTREVKDLIGAATRRLGGSPQLELGTSSGPFFGPEDIYVNWVLPNAVSEWAVQRQSAGVLSRVKQVGDLSQTMLEIADRLPPNTILTGADLDAYLAALSDTVFVSEFMLTGIGLDFARQADADLERIEAGLRTRLYYASPRVFTVSSIGDPTEAVTTTVDLRHTSVHTLVYPGQAVAAGRTAQWVKGVNESILEGAALARGEGAPALTTMQVFDEMVAQGIDPVLIQPNDYGVLDAYDFSPEALAHVIEALLEGKQVLIPSRAVLIAGEPTFAWWEIDPVTGETISVGENGLHPAALEYRMLKIVVEAFIESYAAGENKFDNKTVQLAESALKIGLKLREYFFAVADGLSQGGQQRANLNSSQAATLNNGWRSLPAYLCPHSACGVEQFFLSEGDTDPVPLPELAFSYVDAPWNEVAITTVSAPANGSGTPAFSLSVNPSSSSITPGAAASFQAQLASNFADDFTVAAYSPIGWSASISTTGQVVVQPAEGVTPGGYTIQLVAQAQLHPELIETTTYTITILNQTDAQISIVPEPKITVALGAAALTAEPNETNDGETEAPGAAYTIVLTNTSGSTRTFEVSVSGPPSDWVILNASRSTTATVSLRAGEVAHLGLYLSPSNGAVPTPGTNYPINVSATSAPINVQASSSFNMPSQPFNFMLLDPANLYLPPNSSTPVNLSIQNVGNASGSFNLAAHALPISATINSLPSAPSLAQGASASLPLTLTLGAAKPGATFPLVIAGDAPNSTTQYAVAGVRVAGPYSGPIFQAADQLTLCPVGEPNLSALLTTLAVALANLESSCDSGACDLNQRDQAVRAAQDTASYASSLSPVITADDALLQAANVMAAHTSVVDLQNDMAALRAAVAPLLKDQVCEVGEHLPSLRWSTGYSAALINQPRDYALELTNRGTLSTTYAVTVTLPNGSQSFNISLNPGATITYTYLVSGSAVGLLDLMGQAEAIGPEVGLSGLSASATARLNVVDRFVQLTAVNPDPSFVETGVSSTTIKIEVNNLASLPIAATARIAVTAPTSGSVVYSATQSLRVLGATQTYNLGLINTSGWAAGVYTVTIDLLCANDLCAAPDPLPNGQGYGYLTVGQGLQIEHAVVPETVTAGTFTVTTIITSELTAPPILPPAPPLPHLPSPDIGSVMSGEGLGVRSNAVASQWPITRTENTSTTIVYSGTWAVITHTRASQNNFSRSVTVSNTATFTFTGPWINLGFATASDSGQADILIDGVDVSMVDTYSRDNEVGSFIFDNLGAGAHTLTIRVRGTRHPNSNGNNVSLDYIDVWDGTDMPAGRVEQDDPHVWRSGGWTDTSSASASGGSYMSDAAGNDASAWFAFTGDSISYVGYADSSAHRLGLSIDGAWRGYFNLYAPSGEQRVISFNNLGPGAHVIQVRHYSGPARVDAFETPGLPPFYTPPAPSGITRYEEYHPAITYNGYDYFHRLQSWNENLIVPIMSDGGLVSSNAASNTISLTFDGVWASIGFREVSDGGRAEIFVDGISYGTTGTYSSTNGLKSFEIGGLVSGTHTLDIVVLGQPDPPGVGRTIYFDYVDVWDGNPLPDGFVNAQRRSADGRLRFNSSGTDAFDANALEGDYFTSGLPNSSATVWYPFTGSAFTLYGFSRSTGSTARVYVDGVLIDTPNFIYPFSTQPLPKHYLGFSDGPHVVRVFNQATMRIDGFASGATSHQYRPLLEWAESDRTAGASIWGGLHVPVAVGDLDGNGEVELVVASSNIDSNGELFVLRGDGGDTGDGDPIIWSRPYNIFNGFEDVAAPTIAELDGQPGAEIIHSTVDGVFVYHHDGSTYWQTDTVKSHVFFAAPAVGNLDADPDPEIVINMNRDVVVFEHDGALSWRLTLPAAAASMPVLADLTGDGLLDILVYESGSSQVRLYDYGLGSPTLVWTTTVTNALSIYGAPAVADIDGNLPGGDPGPEVAISSNGWLHVLNGEDGSSVWSSALDSGNSAGVSIADLDGDGEVEIVTGMHFNGGRIYVVNADGSILWSAPALDNSPLNASVMDLDGDGAYEVAFNGADQGLTIYDGHNGDVLFNEPHAGVVSKTGSDYPLFADVDNDGHGELVVTAQGGLRVFGFDGVWTEARPLWNQLNYHINNINDDLTVPFSEWNSWETHNTYRTQSPSRYPLPNYAIDLTHTVGLNNVFVLTDTFSTPPDRSAQPAYGWSYHQAGGQPIVTRTFQSRLMNLQAGESRIVAQGTQVSYTLSSGSNRITLPPLYVNALPVASLTPSAQEVASGETAIFTLTVRNASATETICALDLAGLPDEWFSLPPTITVPAAGSASLTFSITIPIGSGPGPWTFSITANASSASGQVGGEVVVAAPTLHAAITPIEQTALVGTWAPYTLTLTNTTSSAYVIVLSGSGLAEVDVPASITVTANSAQLIAFNARVDGDGPHPFSVIAERTDTGERAEADAILIGTGSPAVALTLDPATASTGPGSTAIFTVSLANLGTAPVTLDLDVAAPGGWQSDLTLYGQPVDQVTLAPTGLDTLRLQLALTPPDNANVGAYAFAVAATSQSGGGQPQAIAATTVTGTVQVIAQGVQIDILSGPASIAPGASGTWQVQVTNAGAQSDTFDLSAFGPLSPTASLSPASVTLAGGQAQTIQLIATATAQAQAGSRLLGVLAQSRANNVIRDEDSIEVQIETVRAAVAQWNPNSLLIVSGTLGLADLTIENTGNSDTTFDVALNSVAHVTATLPFTQVVLPPHSQVSLPVAVMGDYTGTYTLIATVTGGAVPVQAQLSVNVNAAPRLMYLPLIANNADPAARQLYLPLILR
ncbi:hypothetical protein TFLX_00702 [Thermoflexales bacterium]|nr:hypothetical protein TFLX_00702 [Thermoflexales bacterium]